MKTIKKTLCLLLALFCLQPPPAFGDEMTVPVEFADFSEKYGEYFLEEDAEPIITENSYQSHDMYFEIRSERANKSDVYIVDIYVRSVEVIQRAFGGGKWGGNLERVPAIAERSGAILAITGDNSQNFKKGWIFINGERKRKCSATIARHLCVLYKNGVMETIKGSDVDNKAISNSADQIWQTFLFGPGLLDADGKACTKFNSGVSPANPRSVIGYFEPGHYCFVQVDGRSTKSALESGSKNSGMKLVALAEYMEGLGCKAAYNLDGGQSSVLWFNGEIISTPYNGGRKIADVVALVPSVK